jgi:hypothetical protein
VGRGRKESRAIGASRLLVSSSPRLLVSGPQERGRGVPLALPPHRPTPPRPPSHHTYLAVRVCGLVGVGAPAVRLHSGPFQHPRDPVDPGPLAHLLVAEGTSVGGLAAQVTRRQDELHSSAWPSAPWALLGHPRPPPCNGPKLGL